MKETVNETDRCDVQWKQSYDSFRWVPMPAGVLRESECRSVYHKASRIVIVVTVLPARPPSSFLLRIIQRQNIAYAGFLNKWDDLKWDNPVFSHPYISRIVVPKQYATVLHLCVSYSISALIA